MKTFKQAITKKEFRRRLWKTLNIFVGVTTVLNVSMAAFWVAPQVAQAASIGSYDQCANDIGSGYSSGDTGCRWTNGNLQKNNSLYAEGDATVQRVWLTGFTPGSSHTVTLTYGTTKGGKHAYDYLTRWNWSENWLTEADLCQSITGCDTADASENSLAIPHDPNGSGQFETGTRNFVMRGGALNNATSPDIVNGTYAGDSETAVTVSFTVGTSGSMCSGGTCSVALFFGAHVAKTAEWFPFNGTTGATSISGSPYHVALSAMDGTSIGQRDNQMQAGAIANVVIQKQTVPSGSTQLFNFTGSNSALSGSIADGGEIIASLNGGTYTVTEGTTAGWALTNLACVDPTANTTWSVANRQASINVATGETVTCIFTNSEAPTLTVTKVVQNNHGGTATASQFPLFVDSTNVISGQTNSFAVGNHTVSETPQPGYTQLSITGACDAQGNVSLSSGDHKSCTITNQDVAPTLKLVKLVTTDNGGTATPADWTLSATGNPDQGSFSDSGDSTTFHTVFANTQYTLAESGGPSGYSAGTWSCDGGTLNGNVLTLGLGANVTCSITNNDQPGTLIVKKVLHNDNGGTAVVTDFSFKVNGGNSIAFEADAQNDLAVDSGHYTVVENSAAGYAATYDNCTNVFVPNGGSATCTITNDDIQPKLTVTKVVINDNGGTAVVSDFPLFVGQTSVTSGTQNGFNAGHYVVSETNMPGYTGTISGDCDANGNVSLNPGDVKSCTITNNDIAPQLTVIKHVINDNGGTKTAADFTMHVTGTNVSNGSFPGNESGTTVTLNQGSYTVGENGLAGYAQNLSGDCSGTINVGEQKTCTITNNDIQPKLTVTKVVINDNGGTKVVSDFPLFVGPTQVTSGAQNGFDAATYTVSETQQSGYQGTISGDCDANGQINLLPGDVKSCTITNNDIAPQLTVYKYVVNDNGGTLQPADFTLHVNATNANPSVFSGSSAGTGVTLDQGSYEVTEDYMSGYKPVFSTDCTGTINVGQTKTCIVTNTAQAAHLVVYKHVVNDNGGTAVAGDFTMSIGGVTVPSGSTFPGDEQGTDKIVMPGDYQVSENGPDGYASEFSTDCRGSIALGQTKICEVTNNDVAPSLTLVKIVDNSHHGDAVATDWTLSAAGTTPISGPGGAVSDSSFAAGTYALSESTGPSGYTPGTWTCQGGTQDGDHITLALDQSATCTITNFDQPATITLVKDVINDNGGQAGVNDFGLSIGGTPVDSGQTIEVNSNTSYALDEASVPGYQFVSLTGEGCPSQLGGSVNLNEGEHITCTITNNDIAPQLTVIKHVINDNGGTKSAGDFTMNVTGTNVSKTTFAGSETGVTVTLDQGAYSVDESAMTGYAKLLSADCSGTISIGQTKTCTITNNDIAPLLTVIKHVVNDQGGTKTAADFTLNVSGTNVSSTAFPGNEQGTTVTLNQGAYSVSEGATAGYLGSLSVDCTGTISVGESKTCTVTNNDIAPNLSITKVNNVAVFANPGNTITYTVVVTNAATANDTARSVVLHDVLPSGFTYALGGGSTKDFALGDIAPGASVTTSYDVVISSSQTAGTYTNTATAQGSNTPPVSAASSVEVRVPQVLGISTEPTMTLTKTVNQPNAQPGSIVTYTVTVTNTGDVDLTNVVLTDTLPAGFVFVEGDTRTKTWTIGTLLANHRRVVNYDVRVTDQVKTGIYQNIATVLTTELDPLSAKTPVTVRVPKVLGLATTGATARDYAIFALGLSLLSFGLYLSFRSSRRTDGYSA